MIAAGVVNSGLIVAANAVISGQPSGTLDILGNLIGSGTIDIEGGAGIRLNAVSTGQAIPFAGTSELILNTPGNSFGNVISNFSNGDRIEFGNGMTITSASVLNVDTIAVDSIAPVASPVPINLTDVSFGPGSSEKFSWVRTLRPATRSSWRTSCCASWPAR